MAICAQKRRAQKKTGNPLRIKAKAAIKMVKINQSKAINISLKLPNLCDQTSSFLFKKEVGHLSTLIRYRQTPVHTQTNNPPVGVICALYVLF